MKKKLLAITLCLAMTVSAMAGCGSKQDTAPADTGSQNADASAQSGARKTRHRLLPTAPHLRIRPAPAAGIWKALMYCC